MIHTAHKLGYCAHCRTDMIICKTCGNNCCNGGSGVVDGAPCKDCLDAYDVQDAYYANPLDIEFAGGRVKERVG